MVESRGGVIGWHAARARRWSSRLAVAGGLLAAGIGLSGTPLSGTPAGAAETASPPTVRILAASVDPPTVQVAPGDAVIWVNESGGDRSIVASDASFDSGTVKNGGRFQFAFTEPRTVTYTVNPGAGVTGTVIVAAAGTTVTPPTATPTGPPTDMAYTGAGSALTGLGGGLALAFGAWLLLQARRFGPLAFTGFGRFSARDDLLPTRRHRRKRREQARRAPPRR